MIHIGFPKTATTWLQNRVFADPEQGMTSPWGARAGFAIEQFVLADPFGFDPVATRSRFSDGLESAARAKLVPVLSEETLVGDPAAGHYWGHTALEQICATFPDARILVTIREQRSYVASAYREFILGGGYFDLDRYLGLVPGAAGFGGICRLNALEYHRVVEWLQARLGAERVGVMLFEDLVEDPRAFLESLYRFAGVEPSHVPDRAAREHVGERGLTLRLRRRMNRYVPRPDFMQGVYYPSARFLDRLCRAGDRLLPGSWYRRAELALRQQVDALVGTRYARSNRRLAELLGRRHLPQSYALPAD